MQSGERERAGSSERRIENNNYKSTDATYGCEVGVQGGGLPGALGGRGERT